MVSSFQLIAKPKEEQWFITFMVLRLTASSEWLRTSRLSRYKIIITSTHYEEVSGARE